MAPLPSGSVSCEEFSDFAETNARFDSEEVIESLRDIFQKGDVRY
jgi:hypothetical protein